MNGGVGYLWSLALLAGITFGVYSCSSSGRDEQEAACELDARQFIAIHDNNIGYTYEHIAEATELCMRAHGYTLKNEACPKEYRLENNTKPYQQVRPVCYVATKFASFYK